jgi:DNA polymerase elongation subunit (family B)
LESTIIKQYQGEFGIGNNIPIAAAVTTYTRMIINEYKLKALSLGHKLYYSDTDSLMISGPLNDSDISSTALIPW